MREIEEPADCADAANSSCSEVVGADCESLADEEELPIAKGDHTWAKNPQKCQKIVDACPF
jgi:hypothetical protein